MTNLLGEFVGTLVLIVFGCGVVANVCLKGSKAEGAGWMVIATAWGFAVMLGVFTAVSLGAPQGDLNPAVTLFKTFMGIYTVGNAIATMMVQLLGAMVGAIIVYLIYLPHWAVTEDKATKLGIFATAPAIRSYGSNFLCEFLATFFLLCMIFVIFNPNNGTFPPGVGPYIVGVLIWALGLSLGGPTGYALNPARDLGPRIAHAILPIPDKGGNDWEYSWVPILGPMTAAVVAFLACITLGII